MMLCKCSIEKFSFKQVLNFKNDKDLMKMGPWEQDVDFFKLA